MIRKRLPIMREGVYGESRLQVKDESWQVLVGEGAQRRKSWLKRSFPSTSKVTWAVEGATMFAGPAHY